MEIASGQIPQQNCFFLGGGGREVVEKHGRYASLKFGELDDFLRFEGGEGGGRVLKEADTEYSKLLGQCPLVQRNVVLLLIRPCLTLSTTTAQLLQSGVADGIEVGEQISFVCVLLSWGDKYTPPWPPSDLLVSSAPSTL